VNTGAVVLVHGLWMTGLELVLLRRFLERRGLQVHRFRYATVGGELDENLDLLHAFVSGFPERTHMVGHSLGGVLTLHMLRHYPDAPVGRVVCLGPPLTDSAASRRLARSGWSARILGKTLSRAVLREPLVRWSGSQEVGVVAGTLSLGLGAVIAKLPAPNDGVVCVSETRLPGVTDHIELPVSHTGLVLSQSVAQQTHHFLRNGRFRREGSI